jgi:hypothetical protein
MQLFPLSPLNKWRPQLQHTGSKRPRPGQRANPKQVSAPFGSDVSVGNGRADEVPIVLLRPQIAPQKLRRRGCGSRFAAMPLPLPAGVPYTLSFVYDSSEP